MTSAMSCVSPPPSSRLQALLQLLVRLDVQTEMEKPESPDARETVRETTKRTKSKFSEFLTSPMVSVSVGNRKTFLLHSALLALESEQLFKALRGDFREAEEKKIDLPDEDPELFGYFVEYLYRDRSLLSRDVAHYSEYVTLAKLYALGERLVATNFQLRALWRFTKSLSEYTTIPDHSICDLLEVACTAITKRVIEDPMRAHIFWYATSKISDLQKFATFQQLLEELPEVGACLCMRIKRERPAGSSEPLQQRFQPESEHDF